MFLLHVLITTTLIAGLGILGARRCAHDAPLRHATLLGALVGVAACPLLVAAVDWAGIGLAVIRVPAAWLPATAAREARATESSQLTGAHPSGVPRQVDGRSPQAGATLAAELPERDAVANASAEAAGAAQPSARSSNMEEQVADTSPSAAAARPVTSRAAGMWWDRALSLATGVWLVGSLGLAIGLLRSWQALAAIRNSALPVEVPALREALDAVRRTLGVSVLPPVVASARVRGPMAIGLRQPLVVLPQGIAEQLAERELRDVLLHEVAHVERFDDIVVVFQAVVRAAFWPQPLVHWLNRELAAAREDICDNYVIAAGDRVGYAETLLRMAESAGADRARPAQVGLLPGVGILESRVERVLDEGRRARVRLTPPAAALVAIACGAATLLVASGRILPLAEAGVEPPSVAAAGRRGERVAQEEVARAAAAWPSMSETPSASPLRFAPQAGEAFSYRVTIRGREGSFNSRIDGLMTYQVTSADGERVVFECRGELESERRLDAGGGPGPLGYQRPSLALFRGCGRIEATVVVSPFGDVLDGASEHELPFGLGDAASLVFESVPQAPIDAWTAERPLTFVEFSSHFPGAPVVSPLSANRHVTTSLLEVAYRVVGRTGNEVTVAANYLAASPTRVREQPAFELTGATRWVFDAARGMPASIEREHHLTQRQGNFTYEIPVTVVCRLVTEAERAAFESERAARSAAIRQAALSPLAADERRTMLEELPAGRRVIFHLNRLLEAASLAPDPEIVAAVQPITSHKNRSIRSLAERVVAKWSGEETRDASTASNTSGK